MRSKLAMLALGLVFFISACKKEEKIASDTSATSMSATTTAIDTETFGAHTTVQVIFIGMGLADGVKAPNNPVTLLFPSAMNHQAFISVDSRYSPTLTDAMIQAGKTLDSVPHDSSTYAQYTIKGEEIGFQGIQDSDLQYRDDGSMCPMRNADEHSLHWMPSLSDILGSAQTLATTATTRTRPIGINARLEIAKGKLETTVRDWHVWDFKAQGSAQPVFRQALAGVLKYTFTIPAGQNLVITSRVLSGNQGPQDLMTVKPDGNQILITFGNTLPNDRIEHAVANVKEDPHFSDYYELLATRLSTMPTPFQSEDECGGGGSEPGVTCGLVRR